MTGNSNPVGNPVITQAHESISPAASQAAEGEFGRFGDLAQKLAQVPKAEVDEKRKES
jgi:hypothetical protein